MITRQFSQIIAIGSIVIIALFPFFALYYLINIDQFSAIAKSNLNLPIHWHTVTELQYYGLWLLTAIYASTGVAALYFLWLAFSNFAKGELFNLCNSRHLRLFSIFIFIQAVAKPIHFVLSSLLLSMNHPVGQKVLSISFGSDEIKTLALAIILWVMSDLLVSACKLNNENKQFI